VLSQWRVTISEKWRKFKSWSARVWSELRPGPETKAGAIAGCAVLAVSGILVFAIYSKSGFGLWFDFLFGILAAAVIVLAAFLIVPLLITFIRSLPRKAAAWIAGFTIITSMAWMPIGMFLGPPACLAAGILGATIATWRSGKLAGAPRKRIAATAILGLLSLAALIFIAGLAVRDWTDAPVHVQAGPKPAPIQAANPGEPGPFKVRKLTYGAKDQNQRRPEYNKPDVNTPTVDASRFFKDFKGWKRNLRKRYWGFDFDKLPLNATVWLPEGAGPFPLVLIVHGNHNMAEFSDPGYQYLGELLASRGFILATIDENFLNSGLFNDPPKQQAVRGWMLLEHLKQWQQWSRDPNNPLHAGIDFNQIALMGHSRGGEATATAALFNKLEHYPDDAAIGFQYNFPIKSLIAIAPPDGQYKPAAQNRIVEDVNYFTFQGASDADVSNFMGSAQYDRVKYPRGGDWFKAELYIERANHGQFNTVWGRSDAGYPMGWFLHLKPLLDPEDQRRIARVYISAFVEATLRGKREYQALFDNPDAAPGWVPRTTYLHRMQRASYRPVAEFNEDPNVNTTTAPGGRIDAKDLSVWREARIPYRNGDRPYNGVFIGWNTEEKEDAALKPEYTITLPPDWKLTRDARLQLSIAALDEDAPRIKEESADKKDEKKSDKKEDKKKDEKDKQRPAPDFTIEIAGSNATVAKPLSEFGLIPSPIRTVFTKLSFIDSNFYKHEAEPAFQTITIPLSAFAGVDQPRTIRFKFDRTKKAMLLINQIGVD
jgi:hypothetical protein